MSHFRVSFDVVKASAGGSARRRSAYQRCANEDGYKFGHKSDELQHNEVMLPDGADPKLADPRTLWKKIEAHELGIRKDAQLARTFEIDIPKEVPEDLHAEFMRDQLEFLRERGFAVEFSIHKEESLFEPGEFFSHGHGIATLRHIGPAGLDTKKDRAFNSMMTAKLGNIKGGKMRKQFADQQNAFFGKHGIDAKVTHEALPKGMALPVASKKVIRALERYRKNEKKALAQGREALVMPDYIKTFLDERAEKKSAIEEYRAALMQVETLTKDTPATSIEENSQETTNDGPGLPNATGTPPGRTDRDDRREEDSTSDNSRSQSREERINEPRDEFEFSEYAISYETAATEDPEGHGRSDSDRGRQIGGDPRDLERETRTWGRERDGSNAEPDIGTDADAGQQTRKNRDRFDDLRKSIDRLKQTPPTHLEKMRMNNAARSVNERIKSSPKHRETPAKHLSLLDKVKMNSVAKRISGRFEELRDRIKSRIAEQQERKVSNDEIIKIRTEIERDGSQRIARNDSEPTRQDSEKRSGIESAEYSHEQGSSDYHRERKPDKQPIGRDTGTPTAEPVSQEAQDMAALCKAASEIAEKAPKTTRNKSTAKATHSGSRRSDAAPGPIPSNIRDPENWRRALDAWEAGQAKTMQSYYSPGP